MRNIIYILIILTFYHCSSINLNREINKTSRFQELIHYLRPISLPFDYSLYDNNNLVDLKINLDSLFVPIDFKVLRFLPDTSKYIGLIMFMPADALVPILVTFDKSGNLIDKKNLYLSNYSPDCGIFNKSTVHIDKNCTIKLVEVDTVFKCDEFGTQIDSSKTIYLFEQNGMILENGEIVLNAETKNIIN